MHASYLYNLPIHFPLKMVVHTQKDATKWDKMVPMTSHKHPLYFSKTVPSMEVVEMVYFLRISSAILPCSIRSKASATDSQVGVVVLSNQQISISVLQRSLSPRWFFSIVPSWWLFKSRFTPSECQSKTDFKAFLSAFRVGVSRAVGRQHHNPYLGICC